MLMHHRIKKKLDVNYLIMVYALLDKSCKQNPKYSSFKVTYFSSHKPSKLDEQDMLDTAGEVTRKR